MTDEPCVCHTAFTCMADEHEPSSTNPWTVTLAWTPDQNHGYVATLNGRVPIASIVGLIRVKETLERIADEYGLTLEQVKVIARLADEGWAQ